jgi:threonyl-tRNA synthetase
MSPRKWKSTTDSEQMALPEKAAVEQSDYKPLETIVNTIVKEKQPFERLTLSKEDL